MTTETNANTQTVLRAYRELVDGGNMALADELLAPDYTGFYSGAPQPVRGPEGFRQFLGGFTAAFPDLRHDIEQVICEGDTVVVQTTARGTHQGELMGMLPATGRTMAISAIAFFTLRDGRVIEQHTSYDLAGMMAQLTA